MGGVSAVRATHGGLWRVAWTVAWRGMHTYIRRPDLIFPSLIFPLVFFASFAGGLSALGKVPGFTFPAGYTAFQFVFVMCQSAMFLSLIHICVRGQPDLAARDLAVGLSLIHI